MKSILLLLFCLTANLHALDAEAIRKIADEPHDRENLVEELKLYPEAREYKVRMRRGATAANLEAGPEVVATEKTVRGQYLVSQLMFPGWDKPMIQVVNYDKRTATFRKWVLLPDGVVGTSTGVADFDARTIAWVSDKAQGNPPTTVIAIETHTDEKSSWKERILHDGKVIAVSEGEARKTR